MGRTDATWRNAKAKFEFIVHVSADHGRYGYRCALFRPDDFHSFRVSAAIQLSPHSSRYVARKTQIRACVLGYARPFYHVLGGWRPIVDGGLGTLGDRYQVAAISGKYSQEAEYIQQAK
jgi:hypothetical protein